MTKVLTEMMKGVDKDDKGFDRGNKDFDRMTPSLIESDKNMRILRKASPKNPHVS